MNDPITDLAAALRPLVFRLYYVARRQTPQHQLTLTQGSIVRALVEGGPARMSALAEAEGVQLPSMTNVIGRLERMGIVRRVPDPADRRATRVELTETGRRFYDEVVAAREEFIRDRLTGLSTADRTAIAAAIPAFERLLDQEAPADSGRND